MKKTYALAACAAFTIGFAACGDDDDDASGDTTAVTIAAGAPDTEAADETDAADDTATTVAGEVADTASAGTEPAVEVSDDEAADCQDFADLLSDLPELDQPAVGDELSDDFKDGIGEIVDGLEGLDLRTDGAQAARDSLVNDFNELADADTMTEELQQLGDADEVLAFDEICIAANTDS